METKLFKKTIPADLAEPARNGQLIAKYHFKSLQHVVDDVYFIGYYNCGVHYATWAAARAKYNELTSVK